MLLEKRVAFKPTEYAVFDNFSKLIDKTHWIHDELDFITDVRQFHEELTDSERYMIGTILKTFAQTETIVADDFWGHIKNFIPKPEFIKMAMKFAENEYRHADAYDRLSEELGLSDYRTFMEDGVAKERLENLASLKVKDDGNVDIMDLAITLGIFGGCLENVALFSQFAILLSFSQRGLLSDVGTIIAWSQKDEGLHAFGAMTTFNILMEEYPDQLDKDWVEKNIKEAFQLTFDIENHLIDQIFANGDLPNLSKAALIEFMKNRVNLSLGFMKMTPLFENIDKALLQEMFWFEAEAHGVEMTDFFWARPVEYSKAGTTYSKDSLF